MADKVWVLFWLPYMLYEADITVCGNKEALWRDVAVLLRDRVEKARKREYTPAYISEVDQLLQRDQVKQAFDLWATMSHDLIFLHEREVNV